MSQSNDNDEADEPRQGQFRPERFVVKPDDLRFTGKTAEQYLKEREVKLSQENKQS